MCKDGILGRLHDPAFPASWSTFVRPCMTDPASAINPPTWGYFASAVRSFVKSEMRLGAWSLFVSLFILMCLINGLNVVNSYVGRDFMSAIAVRDAGGFVHFAWLYAGVFMASTVVAVFFRFVEERLAMLWRDWQTRRLLEHYLAHRVYLQLHRSKQAQNPDQNIAEDVKAFTMTTLSFVVMLMNGTFTAVAFSGVLWSISPTLFGVAVGYASVGTLLTVLLGRPLVWLNYRQFDREAEFRSELVHLKENADAVAVLGREGRIRAHLMSRLGNLLKNWRRVIAVNRNVGFFTTGYNYMIQLIPALIVAPLFFAGDVEFGVITQSAMAFAQLLGAFSLIVTQFQSISTYTAVMARLGTLVEEMQKAAQRDGSLIELCEGCDVLGYEGLTLRSPDGATELLHGLSVTFPRGQCVLINGHCEPTKTALFRATAGLWEHGTGKIIRPCPEHIAFITERPYLHEGTLREALVHLRQERQVSDEEIMEALRLVGQESLVERAGGLDTPHEWSGMLTLGAQQLLVVARVLISKVHFAVMDRIVTALSPDEMKQALSALRHHGVTYVAFGNSGDDRNAYDAVLDIREDGSWGWIKELPKGDKTRVPVPA